jgi:predicted amidohydrolase
MTLKETLFIRYLAHKTRPAVLQRHLQTLCKGCATTPDYNRRQLTAAAAQVHLDLVPDARDYVGTMHSFAARAAEAGASLLVYPENNSFPLLGLLPGIGEMAKNLDGEGDGPAVSVADLFRALGPVFNRVAHTTFSHLARHYGLWIVAGSYPTPVQGRVFNRALIYAPSGALAGTQDKVHLTLQEHQWAFTPGADFRVYTTPFGRLAAPVCMDATYFETFRILAGLGAEIVAVPIANPEAYNPWLALRGIWPRVQESLVYGVKSALVGELFGHTLTGKAGIFAPLPLTPNGDGVLAETQHPDREGFACAALDLEALRELREQHPYLGDKNPALMKKYFPGIYSTMGG